MRPGIQAAAHVAIVARSEGWPIGLLASTMDSTEMEMIRMVKSTVWTLSWPIQPLAMQDGDAGMSGLPVRPQPR